MQQYYPDLKLCREIQIRRFIPKKHLPGHGFDCRTIYSFNWLPGVGRTHGETVEQEWSHINGAVLMTREMGSGARHSALDDHWGGWNWRKLVDIGMLYYSVSLCRVTDLNPTGEYFHKSLQKAVLMREKHRIQSDKYSSTFPAHTIVEWKKAIKEWEADHTKSDPYAEPEHSKLPLPHL